MDAQDLPGEGYDGPALLSTAAVSRLVETTDHEGIRVEVRLRGHFEPLDGLFHWYGRVAADDELAARHPSGSTVVLTTPHGRAEGRLTDLDPWGRFRISGTGRPPY